MQKWIPCARFIGCQSDFSHGISGHGKSYILYSCVCEWAERKLSICKLCHINQANWVATATHILARLSHTIFLAHHRYQRPLVTGCVVWFEPISCRCPNVFYSPLKFATLSFTLTSQQEVRPHPQPISHAVKTKSSGNWHMLTCESFQVPCPHACLWTCVCSFWCDMKSKLITYK